MILRKAAAIAAVITVTMSMTTFAAPPDMPPGESQGILRANLMAVRECLPEVGRENPKEGRECPPEGAADLPPRKNMMPF